MPWTGSGWRWASRYTQVLRRANGPVPSLRSRYIFSRHDQSLDLLFHADDVRWAAAPRYCQGHEARFGHATGFSLTSRFLAVPQVSINQNGEE
jgi:hypothetical protein